MQDGDEVNEWLRQSISRGISELNLSTNKLSMKLGLSKSEIWQARRRPLNAPVCNLAAIMGHLKMTEEIYGLCTLALSRNKRLPR